jgi:SAM-dependent methyltransferase
MWMAAYSEVTELAGDEVSQEQVLRVCTRYGWAAGYCRGKDVLEIACGTGPGLGLLQSIARRLVAGDISRDILERARAHYGARIDLRVMDARSLPFPDESLDVIIIFEALYYVPDAAAFAAECQRVLRPCGHVLIASANKDLADFNPSPYSFVYYGVVELRALFGKVGFSTVFYGDTPVSGLSVRQRVLRPIKRTAVALNLIPKSMGGKKLLKRLVFGTMARFPAEVASTMIPETQPLVVLDPSIPDRNHKVILCAAAKCA